MLHGATRGIARPEARRGEVRGSLWPLRANLVSFAAFFPLLFLRAGATDGPVPLVLAITGSALAVAGATIALRSRNALGPAWSLVPTADERAGLVTTGPYRVVRHPLYLGLSMLPAGAAVAFGNPSALLIVVLAVIPTFLWLAAREASVLGRRL